MAKVLVIDDQPEIRALFAEILASDGHQVITAADGASGLALHRLHHPNLVITDLEVPGLHGLEIIARLRDEPGVKLIAISGSSLEVLKAAQDLGATVTFMKPFSIKELMAAVRQLVGEPPRG